LVWAFAGGAGAPVEDRHCGWYSTTGVQEVTFCSAHSGRDELL
jgi:hypothetical protein